MILSLVVSTCICVLMNYVVMPHRIDLVYGLNMV
jgi:hypothetical protein